MNRANGTTLVVRNGEAYVVAMKPTKHDFLWTQNVISVLCSVHCRGEMPHKNAFTPDLAAELETRMGRAVYLPRLLLIRCAGAMALPFLTN